jgi:hypothetical protein
MSPMRCYFAKGGTIVATKEFADMSKEQAIAMAQTLFKESLGSYDGFEIWNRNRKIYREGHNSNRRHLPKV